MLRLMIGSQKLRVDAPVKGWEAHMMSKYIKLTWLAAMTMACASNTVLAIESMDDAALAEQTGQDGISIGLQFPNSTVSYDQVLITDTNGMTGATSPASLVLAPTTRGTDQGVRLFKADGSATANPVLIKLDADANGTKPVFNANITFPTDLKRINISPFSLYIAPTTTGVFTATRASGTTGTLQSNVSEILKVGGTGIDVILTDYNATFNPNNVLGVNVQLGNAPQGHMIMLTGGSISQIKNDTASPIQIMSKNTTTSSLKLNFNMTAFDTNTGFRLSGFYGDMNDAGFTFGKAGDTDKFNLVVSDVIAGCSTGCQDATVFNGLKNGSMGSIGLVGAKVSNLKVNIKGM